MLILNILGINLETSQVIVVNLIDKLIIFY
jgi:hypothetical protein